MKICPRCQSQFEAKTKFCSTSCKYWFNLIKKEKESHLTPAKKRNERYFAMTTGYTRAKPKGATQGKRCKGMITGSMSAMVNVTVEEWAELNLENLHRHFNSIPFYRPWYIRLGNEKLIKEEDIERETGIEYSPKP